MWQQLTDMMKYERSNAQRQTAREIALIEQSV
jgi:hypothetical protein